jgi:hypothetical protein
MRSPSLRRARPRRLEAVPSLVDLGALATEATYVGSPEHKDIPSYAGQPMLRSDASCCPRNLSRDRGVPQEWLREAIKRGAVGAPWEGRFPRYVWFQHDGVVYEGRLVNRDDGSYKGYPLEDDEWPPGIDGKYAAS